MFLWPSLALLAHATGVHATCLPEAIPIAKRIWMKDDAGSNMPVGLLENNWDSSYLFTTLSQILIEEVLGYHTITSEDGTSGAAAHFALGGCLNWNSATDRKCGLNETRMHLCVDSWMSNWPIEAAYIAKYPHLVPEDLGSMGYDGIEGIYVTRETLAKAYESQGLALNFYLSYNQSHHDPKQYFDGLKEVNSSHFKLCNETNFFNVEHMANYLLWTGDDEGLELLADDRNGSYVAKCLDDRFWLSPACRSNSSSCILLLTAGSGWAMQDIMQWASAYAMPISLGVAETFNSVVSLVKGGHFLFYWWEPDASLALQSPSPVIFPPHSAQERAQGNRRTSAKPTYVNKASSRNLQFKAPKVRDFVSKVSFDLQEAQQLLSLTQGGMSFYNASCHWIRNNRKRWGDWVSGITNCSPGYGLADLTGTFLSSREDAQICRECPAGQFSEQFSDAVGTAYRCTICEAGSIQWKAGETQCVSCAKGSYTNTAGQTTCEICSIGSYQSVEGETECLTCPEERTTLLLGAKALVDCVCRAESIESHGICETCSEGLSCPRGSTVQLLLDGQSDLLDDLPMVQSGYRSTVESPLEIYKCISYCPGGRPGTCAANRTGVTCGDCPKFEFVQDERCRPCHPIHSALWAMACPVIFVLVIVSYYVCNGAHVSMRADASSTIFTCLGLMVVFCEIVAVVQSVAVQWPKALAYALTYFEVFGLGFDGMGLGCLAGGWSYAVQSFFFPTVVVGSWFLQLCSQILPERFRRLKWTRAGTCNMLGQLLQEGYITMSNIAFIPFSCFSHPNGAESLLKSTNVLCGSTEHRRMQAFGTILGLLCLAFLVACSYAAWKAPAWSEDPVRMSSIRFLIDRFRPDVWWFGIILLVRGPMLSMPGIIAVNVPGLQMTGLLGILLISVLIQVRFLPWNAPLANVADAGSSSLLLILLSIGIARLPAPPGQWANGILDVTAVVVAVLIFVVWLVVLLAVTTLVCAKTIKKEESKSIINLGTLADPGDVVLILEDLASNIVGWTEVRQQRVEDALKELCVYDYQQLCTSLMLLSVEVGIGDASTPFASTPQHKRILNKRVSKRAKTIRQTRRAAVVFDDADAAQDASSDEEVSGTVTSPAEEESSDRGHDSRAIVSQEL